MGHPARKQTVEERKKAIKAYAESLPESERAKFAEFRMSKMVRADPIRTRPSSRLGKLSESGDDHPSLDDLPRDARRQVKKQLDSWTMERLYNVTLGLPSRVRSFVKKIWKRQDKWGESWEKIAPEMAPGAYKILMQRIEIVVFFSYAVERDGMPSEEKLARLTEARNECDALLKVFAHYFTIGCAARIVKHCMLFTEADNSEKLLGGLADVLDYGRADPKIRRSRTNEALKEIEKNGWKLPERGAK